MDKKQMSQRCLAFFLAIIMIVGIMPLNVFAEQDGDTTSNNEGKVTIQYVDESGNAIYGKYKITSENYPSEAKGKVGEAVDASKIPQPKFIGYVRKGNIVVAGTRYLKDGGYTVEVPYEKLDPFIPAKGDDGQPNPMVTEDVKNTYKKVLIKVDPNKCILQKKQGNKLVDLDESEFLYYLNPVEEKSLLFVVNSSGLSAKSKDSKANEIYNKIPWKFNPEMTTADSPVNVQLSTDVSEKNFKGVDTVVIEPNFMQTKADQLKDKLEPQDIRVWVDKNDTDGSKITWKEGVKLKQADTELQKLLDENTTKYTDLGKDGTNPKVKRNSSKQNLPEGATGSIEVKFNDGSSIIVANQTLYVANEKNVVKPGESNQINPENLPDGNFAVKFLLGEGVKIGNTEGNATTPVLYETYYVKPNTSLKENEIPKTTLLDDSFNDNKWYNGTNDLVQDDYTNIESDEEFVAKATKKAQKTVEYSFKFYNSSKPNEELGASILKGRIDPKVPEKQTDKYVGDKITLPKFDDVKAEKNKKGEYLDLQGTWKFDGWYKSTDTTFTNKLTDAKVSANDAENKLVGKWVLTETPTEYISYEFKIDSSIVGDNNIVKSTHTLPEGVNKQKFGLQKVGKYVGNIIKPDKAKDKFTAVSEKIGDKQGKWTFKEWDPEELTVNATEANNVFKGIWTWKEVDKVKVKYVFNTKPADKTLPEVLAGLKPADGTGEIYETDVKKPEDLNLSAEAVQKALVEKDANGKEIGTWKASEWSGPVKDTTNKILTYTLTWTFTKKVEPAPQPKPGPQPKPEVKPVPEVKIPEIKIRDHHIRTSPVYVSAAKPSIAKEKKSDTVRYIFHIDKLIFEEVRNNETITHKMDVSPVIRNGRTMIPLRFVAEAIGVDVKWDNKTRTAIFTNNGLTAKIQIDGDEIVLSNGKTIKMDSKPLNINGRILVSVVNVANVFGLTNGNTQDGVDHDIEWNNENPGTVMIRR